MPAIDRRRIPSQQACDFAQTVRSMQLSTHAATTRAATATQAFPAIGGLLPDHTEQISTSAFLAVVIPRGPPMPWGHPHVCFLPGPCKKIDRMEVLSTDEGKKKIASWLLRQLKNASRQKDTTRLLKKAMRSEFCREGCSVGLSCDWVLTTL